jgi:hypothetical protein
MVKKIFKLPVALQALCALMRRNLQSPGKAKFHLQPEASLYTSVQVLIIIRGSSRSFDSFETDRLGWQINEMLATVLKNTPTEQYFRRLWLSQICN